MKVRTLLMNVTIMWVAVLHSMQVPDSYLLQYTSCHTWGYSWCFFSLWRDIRQWTFFSYLLSCYCMPYNV